MSLDKALFSIFLRKAIGFLLFFSLAACLVSPSSIAGENAILTGNVQDIDGKPVQGAEVSVYTSPNVRGTADFISPKTDGNGKYSIILPRGKYWAVARLRRGSGQFGPLMLGDKHSGDAVEIELTQELRQVNFTVMNLKEAAASSERKISADIRELKGRILDEKGNPIKGAYAFANRIGKASPEIPDYLSSWVDEEGQFALFLPSGKYFLGSATAFPPGPHAVIYKEIMVDRDAGNIDMMIPNK